MATVKVTLTKIVDDTFPVWGAFEFTDQSGKVIVIHEKLPVVGIEVDGLRLPLDVELECDVISASNASVLIDTTKPHAIEDIRGQTQFQVSASLVRN
ncbi:MAG: hypothetical protein AB8B62_19815 [Roseobacter sp.]